MNRLPIIFISVIICQILVMDSLEAQNSKLKRTQNAQSQNSYALLNINNVTTWVRADGQLNHSPNGDNGIYFPRGTANVIYQDGFIWGGKAYIDPAMNQPAPYDQLIRVGGGTYTTGTRSGRVIGSGETAEQSDPDAVESRIYRIRRDYYYMTEEELQRDAAEMNEISFEEVTNDNMKEIQAQYTRDWQEWPVQFGAPFIDRNNNGFYDPPPEFNQSFSVENLIAGNYDEPGIAAGDPNSPADQVIWTVFNDLKRETTTSFAGSEPIGLELQLTQWAFKSKDNWNGIYYRKLKIINKGGVQISEDGTKGSFWIDGMYICLWTDGDVGNHSDDLVGSVPELNLGYYYNETNLDNEFRKFNLPPPSRLSLFTRSKNTCTGRIC